VQLRIRSSSSVHYDHDHEPNTVKKNSPPGVDQLWQHVFFQFSVGDYGVLSTFSSVICRVREGAWGGGGVAGTSGNGTSGNGTVVEASAYSLVEATVEFLREFVVVMIGRST